MLSSLSPGTLKLIKFFFFFFNFLSGNSKILKPVPYLSLVLMHALPLQTVSSCLFMCLTFVDCVGSGSRGTRPLRLLSTACFSEPQVQQCLSDADEAKVHGYEYLLIKLLAICLFCYRMYQGDYENSLITQTFTGSRPCEGGDADKSEGC